MLNQPTLNKLQHLQLPGMAKAYREQLEQPSKQQLSFDDRLGLMVDHELFLPAAPTVIDQELTFLRDLKALDSLKPWSGAFRFLYIFCRSIFQMEGKPNPRWCHLDIQHLRCRRNLLPIMANMPLASAVTGKGIRRVIRCHL